MAGWDAAASDALGDKKSTQDKLDLHQNSTDMAAMATYAEYYNGVGYAARGKPSPYVFSGTDQYTSGKYVADGVYSAKTKDTQLGVMSMVQDLMDKEKAEQKPAGK
jgi:lysozyme family protein